MKFGVTVKKVTPNKIFTLTCHNKELILQFLQQYVSALLVEGEELRIFPNLLQLNLAEQFHYRIFLFL